MPNSVNDVRQNIELVNQAIQEEVGRNMSELFKCTPDSLYETALEISKAKDIHIGVMSGFFIPKACAPETDGPIGAAMLMSAFEKLGFKTRFITDTLCTDAMQNAFQAASVSTQIESVDTKADVDEVIKNWMQAGVTHVLSIERCGKSYNGSPCNMRGDDISEYSVVLDDFFISKPWKTIAIGDGGNEIGMGAIPKEVIANNIKNGEKIACSTPADILITAGVSNWGAYGILAALALINKEWEKDILSVLNPELNEKILKAMINAKVAVDGVTGKSECSVDGIALAEHTKKINQITDTIVNLS